MSTLLAPVGAPVRAAPAARLRHVLVTGATGFVGRHTVQTLLRRGHRVTALARAAAMPDTLGAASLWRIEDLADLGDDAPQRLRGVDAVVHCAARVHVLKETDARPLEAFRRVNVEATLALARAAAAAGVRRFVHLSTIGVHGNATPGSAFRADSPIEPNTPYARSKWEAEQALDALARETGLGVVHLRPPMVYGPAAPGNFALLVRAVRSGLPLPLGGLRQLRSFVGVGNLSDLIAHLVERDDMPPGPYLVSDGRDLSTADFVRRMSAALGRGSAILPVPEGALRFVAGLAGRGEQVDKMAARLVVDIAATRQALGWTPPLSVEQELAAALGAPATEPTP